MRRVRSQLFVSLDGVAEAPDRFVFPFFDDRVGAAVDEVNEASDAVLLGRRTYEEWAAYWPDKSPEDDDFAGYINEVPKHVASTTLDRVEWKNASLLEGDVADAVRALREGSGGDIQVAGSITLLGSLMRMGLVAELSLLVFPVLVGSGKRLFEAKEQVPLRLERTEQLPTGVLRLTYARPD